MHARKFLGRTINLEYAPGFDAGSPFRFISAAFTDEFAVGGAAAGGTARNADAATCPCKLLGLGRGGFGCNGSGREYDCVGNTFTSLATLNCKISLNPSCQDGFFVLLIRQVRINARPYRFCSRPFPLFCHRLKTCRVLDLYCIFIENTLDDEWL